jgi:hypothetical protein
MKSLQPAPLLNWVVSHFFPVDLPFGAALDGTKIRSATKRFHC